MPLPSEEEVAQLLDHRTDSVVGGNEQQLQRRYGLNSLVPIYIRTFPKIRNHCGRMHILFWICRYARKDPNVVKLARNALSDKSKIVRTYACQILAFAQDPDTVVDLEVLLQHRDKQTREDAGAAIAAITEKNHHLWADRSRKGNVFWEPGRI